MTDFSLHLNIVSELTRITCTCFSVCMLVYDIAVFMLASRCSSYSLTLMKHFISHASDEMQNLFSLHANAVEEFHRVVQYFGENPKEMTSVEFFSIFGEFLVKFEVSRWKFIC